MLKNKFASCKEHLLALFISRNVKKTRTNQSILHFFCSLGKERTHKPSKVAAAKTFFSSVYVIDTTCFDECFFFHVITRRHYFLYKFSVTLRAFPTAMLLRSLKQVF